LLDVELNVAQLLLDDLQPTVLTSEEYNVLRCHIIAITSLMLVVTSIAVGHDVAVIRNDLIEIASIPSNVFWL